MSTLNQPHIYDDPQERWLVELRISYPNDDGNIGASTPQEAAAAALEMTRDLQCRSTLWVVTDRETGAVYQLEQSTFDDPEFHEEYCRLQAEVLSS